MAHKGLSPDAVVKAAVELIEQQGRDAFSMRLLADQLGIKTASLYNHCLLYTSESTGKRKIRVDA